jgi:Protein of unknown function (DUF3999)
MNVLIGFVFMLVFVVQVQAEEVTTGDFAAGYFLEVEGGGPFHSLELPAEVHQMVRRADLGDIRVFNGAGEIVPHGLRHVAVEDGAIRQKEGIPFFPLYDNTAANGRTDLTLQVTRRSDGTILNINAGPQQDAGESRITGYLLDLSGLNLPGGGLEFHWSSKDDSSVFNITLQHSNDLQHWSQLVAMATLVDLQHGGERVEKRTVSLSSKPLRYLKLSWQGNGPPLLLDQVTGLSEVLPSLQRRQWADLGNGEVRLVDKELTVEYRTSSHLPVGSAQMNFHTTNPLARIALQSRANDQDPWRTRCEQVFYSLSVAGSEVRSEPCTFPPTPDNRWRALVRADGAGIGAHRQTPVLQLGWTPNELLFIARGAPPYLLAFGSSKLAHQERRTDSDMVLQAAGTAQQKQPVGSARLGKRIELAGDNALKPLPTPPPWKKWLLWAILLLGVGLLAGMARSLLKEMKLREEKRKTEQP